MRLRFSDMSRQREIAKRNVADGTAAIKKWWVGKYKLPPNHRLFQEQSRSDLNLEMLEDLYMERNALIDAIDEGMDSKGELNKRLMYVESQLGEEQHYKDDLIDKWEREIEQGLVPDLNEGL